MRENQQPDSSGHVFAFPSSTAVDGRTVISTDSNRKSCCKSEASSSVRPV